jgi:hypothetical protein
MMRRGELAATLVLSFVAACGSSGGAGTGGSGGGGGTSGSAGADALVGTWLITTKSSDGSTITEKWTFDSNGSLSTTFATSSCTGTASFTGGSWSSTATTVTLDTKSDKCTGAVKCSDSGGQGCAGLLPTMMSTCDYDLSNGGSTLTLSKCTGSSGSTVFTRSS